MGKHRGGGGGGALFLKEGRAASLSVCEDAVPTEKPTFRISSVWGRENFDSAVALLEGERQCQTGPVGSGMGRWEKLG